MQRIAAIVVLTAVSVGVQVAAAQGMKEKPSQQVPVNASPSAGTHKATGTVRKADPGRIRFEFKEKAKGKYVVTDIKP